jgi:hypothetical protein
MKFLKFMSLFFVNNPRTGQFKSQYRHLLASLSLNGAGRNSILTSNGGQMSYFLKIFFNLYPISEEIFSIGKF